MKKIKNIKGDDTLYPVLPETSGPERTMELNKADLIRAFIDSQDVRETSKETYRKTLKQFLIWIEGKGITSPTRETILEYKDYLRDRGLSPLSLTAYIVVVRKFFEWTEGMKYYPNIAKGIKGGKRIRGFKKDSLTVDQVRDLLASIEGESLAGKRDFALLNLLIRTGLRTIEVIRADVKDIRQQGGVALLWIQGKGREDKDQFVILTKESLRPLYEYLKARKNKSKKAPLFTSISNRNSGERLTTRTMRGIVKDRLRKIGIESDRLTAHSLRHTAITLSLKAGATIQEAQALGRHTNINTTLIYAHNIDRIKNAPEKKIDKILAKTT